MSTLIADFKSTGKSRLLVDKQSFVLCGRGQGRKRIRSAREDDRLIINETKSGNANAGGNGQKCIHNFDTS